MRKFVLASLASMAVATPALADDGSWTGAYGGISAGYSSASSRSEASLGGQWTLMPAAQAAQVTSNLSTKQTTHNGAIGAHIGYNYQTGDVVLGAELEATTLGGSAVRSSGLVTYSATQNYTFTNSVDPKNLVALKARLGVAMGGTLAYVAAGWAWVDSYQSAGITGTDLNGLGLLANGSYRKLGENQKTRNGVIVGVGLEQRLSSRFSIRAQYDYTDQGTITYATAYLPNSLNTVPAYTETMNQNLRVHLVRAGVSYHF
ncbi:outer membrane protein [Novosphingobium bradum]|uniref:Outer membrane protein n=1 Tax=Novosphingobium bradum TaxID=1737444 RepID=A0ABV7IQS8_9SPHN